MGQPFVGEIRMFAGNFNPAGWALCNGQLLQIAENDTLFTVIGTRYGGNGTTNFALPDLRGRVPIHFGTSPAGTSYQLGENGGVEQVTLTTQQIPVHTHPLLASPDPADRRGAANGVFGRTPAEAYASEFTPETLSPQTITPQGGSQPHENTQPFLCVNFIISLFGIEPSPN